jgi:hypothetical protein
MTHIDENYCFFGVGSTYPCLIHVGLSSIGPSLRGQHYLKELCHRINEHANVLFLLFC